MFEVFSLREAGASLSLQRRRSRVARCSLLERMRCGAFGGSWKLPFHKFENFDIMNDARKRKCVRVKS